MKAAAFLCLLFSPLWAAIALANDLITQPEASIYLAPPVYNGQFSNKLGDISIPNPSWNIGQFNNPQPLAAGQNYSSSAGASWAFGNTTTRVQFYTSPVSSSSVLENTLELAQNGVSSLACGTEYDLFAGANNPQIYKDPSGNTVASRMGSSEPLNVLSTVQFQVGLAITYEMTNNQCGLNYAGYVYSISLVSTNGYSLFFQIFLRDSRGATQNNSGCPGYPQGKVYCTSSTIDQLGLGLSQQKSNGARVSYSLNVLTQLNKAIAQTPDTNLADWQITNTYFGSLIQGGMTITSRWDSFKLTAY